jgi:hypothetical protein
MAVIGHVGLEIKDTVPGRLVVAEIRQNLLRPRHQNLGRFRQIDVAHELNLSCHDNPECDENESGQKQPDRHPGLNTLGPAGLGHQLG